MVKGMWEGQRGRQSWRVESAWKSADFVGKGTYKWPPTPWNGGQINIFYNLLLQLDTCDGATCEYQSSWWSDSISSSRSLRSANKLAFCSLSSLRAWIAWIMHVVPNEFSGLFTTNVFSFDSSIVSPKSCRGGSKGLLVPECSELMGRDGFHCRCLELTLVYWPDFSWLGFPCVDVPEFQSQRAHKHTVCNFRRINDTAHMRWKCQRYVNIGFMFLSP